MHGPAASGAWGAAVLGVAPAPAGAAAQGVGLWELFTSSFDLFTVLLLAGSVVAVAVIVRCVLEVRAGVIAPAATERRLRELIGREDWAGLRTFVAADRSFVGRVLHAALSRAARDREGLREVAETAAAEQCAHWFRRIEPLNVIGNLGPLLGLAGTVWGMVIAFAALGQSGGQATPAALSAGISKALFHTLLGLLLAIPSLAAFGVFRSRVDRLCTHAMSVSAELIERLPVPARARVAGAPEPTGPAPARRAGAGGA